MFHENDIVRLKRNMLASSATAWPDMPSTDLVAGSIGTIVMVYTAGPTNPEYEVEFVDHDGYTLALLSLKEDDIETATARDPGRNESGSSSPLRATYVPSSAR
jgi:hypothetical protein